MLSGLRLGLAVAVTGVLAETSVASAGLGWQAMQDYNNLRITDMYALLLFVLFAATAINAGVGRLIRYVTRYNQTTEKASFHDDSPPLAHRRRAGHSRRRPNVCRCFPVTGEVIAQVPDATGADVADAVNAAATAAKAWRKVPARERGALVGRLADILAAHADELAELDAIDGGHPVTTMHHDVGIALDGMRLFAGLGGEIKGETIPASGEHLPYTVREPFGVVARIIPFNHPLMFAAAKITAPLVAGSSVVLKPPEVAPLSALRLGELFAGELPPGVLNVVVGDGLDAGRALVRHPMVRRIGFIGSDATGRAIQRDAAETGVKDITLELGGKNALIAFPDASPSEVAKSVVAGMNFVKSSGQSCGSTSRLLVHTQVKAVNVMLS